MKAIILAAGEGIRLRPFTETMPKVMLPVVNKPMLEYVVDAVKASGIDEVVLVVGYKKEVIQDHFKNYPGVNISYQVQDKQLGTAHALLQVQDKIDDNFIMLPGDNIIDADSITSMLAAKAANAIMIKENPQPSKYGVVLCEHNKLLQIIEKPQQNISRYISTGVYKFTPKMFELIEKEAAEGEYTLTPIVQRLLELGHEICTVPAKSWMDIVYPWDLTRVNETLVTSQEVSVQGTVEKQVTMKGAVSVGEGSTIYAGCYIVGPVVIGRDCEIGPNACVFPSTVIGDNSVVHPFSELRNTMVMRECHIGSHSVCSQSIIGRGCRIGNRFSALSGPATVEVEGEYIPVDSVGVAVGEDCSIGSHVVVTPGVIIGRRCTIASQTRVMNHLVSESKVM